MKNKDIDLETLDTIAKKKKNFIIVAILVGVVTILFVSIGSALLNTDKKKLFKERTEIKNNKELKYIQNPEFKENWAISIENRMEISEKRVKEVMEDLSGKQDKVLEDLKRIIREDSAKSSEDIKSLSNNIDSKIQTLRLEMFDQIESQNQTIEQVSIMAKNNTSSAPNTGDLLIGSDLLPETNKKPGLTGLMIIVEKGEATINEEGNVVNEEGESLILNEAGDVIKEETGELVLEVDSEEEIVSAKAEEAIEPEEIIEEAEVEEVVVEETEPEEEILVNKKKNIQMVNIDTSFNEGIINAQVEIAKAEKANSVEEKEQGSYHVTTGLTQAYMITGAYAPAFQEGESEPLPVLFEAEGDILMPNEHLATMEKCWLLGSAKGNMNSQTANIKLVSISCILDGGDYRLEGALSGWVIGENGIPGIHGELLHKNGAWLARTFVSGFLETFSNALGDSGNSSTITFDDNNSESNSNAVNDNVASAGAQGVSTVFNKLGDYYLKMAEQIFPIIEVKGGRTIDILLIGGEELSVVENNSLDITKINDHLSDLRLNKIKKEDTIIETNAFTRSITNSGSSMNDSETLPDFPEEN